MVHTVFKRAWYAETECESNLNCQRRILWRDWFVWRWKCRKWSIWRILLICLTSQLTHLQFLSFVIYSNCCDFGNERKEVHLNFTFEIHLSRIRAFFWNNFSIKKMVLKFIIAHARSNTCYERFWRFKLNPQRKEFLPNILTLKICLHSSNFTSNVVLE